jgi:hypothetical protein
LTTDSSKYLPPNIAFSFSFTNLNLHHSNVANFSSCHFYLSYQML